jgi:hypothetical protein
MDIKLDPLTRDIEFVNGELSLVSGVEEYSQNLGIRMRFFKGEWFLDQREGVPYFEEILGQKPRLNIVSSIYRDIIENTEGFISLEEFNTDYDTATRVLSLSAKIKASNSDEFVEIEEEFII